MHRELKRAACALVLVLGTGAAKAETPSPAPLPNGAVVAPGALQTRALPPGIETGTPAASRSLPLGTPASPPALVAPDPRASPLGSADSSRPPRLTQDPISRSRPHASDVDAGRAGERRLAPDVAPTSGRGPAATSTHDVGDFPPGLSQCVDRVDRAERVACARELYESARGGR